MDKEEIKKKIIDSGVENQKACLRYVLASPTLEPDILIDDFKKLEQAPYKSAKKITDHIIQMETGKVTASGEEFSMDELYESKPNLKDATNRFIKNLKG